ncbi:MAG: hypothetical protein VZR73_00475 [Acutalibacteraceae bacterium]|nr:hypothetical protein [Acutalibacteraceae bacterium]
MENEGMQAIIMLVLVAFVLLAALLAGHGIYTALCRIIKPLGDWNDSRIEEMERYQGDDDYGDGYEYLFWELDDESEDVGA